MEQTSTTAPPANGIRIHPPTIALLCLFGALLLHLMMPGTRTVFAHHFLGLIVVAVGSALCAFAAALFQGRDTTRKPWGEPTTFVTTAPYTFTRNPMYLGVTVALLGFAIFFAGPEMLLAPIAFVVIVDRMVIPREEETMERLFGTAYVDYKARVRRWL